MSAPIFYKRKTGKMIWAIVIALLVFVVVLAAVYCANWWLQREQTTVHIANEPTITTMDVTLDAGVSYGHAVTDTRLIFYSPEHIKFVNNKGELEQNVSLSITNPIISTSGNYALISDRNGKASYLFNGSRNEKNFTLDESIILSKVNSSGKSLFITKGDGHKCSVRVFDNKGEELFKWNSGGLNVLDADISNNNKDIAVSTINTDDGVIKSYIIMFNIAKTKPFTNDVYEDSLFSVIEYSGGYIYCIGDGNTQIYNGYGKKVGTIQYGDRDLVTYKTDGDVILLGFAGTDSGINAKGGVIESYNVKGENIGKYEIEQDISFLDSFNGNVAVKNGRNIAILNNKCKEKFQMNLGMEIRDFLYFGSDSKAVGITGTGAELIDVRR